MEPVSSLSVNRPKTKRSSYRNELYGILFALPAILGLLIFTLGPMIYSLYMSFTDYSGSNSPTFIGLDNYTRMFSGEDQYFYKSLGVTLYFVVLSVPTGIIYSFLMAILLNRNIKGKLSSGPSSTCLPLCRLLRFRSFGCGS